MPPGANTFALHEQSNGRRVGINYPGPGVGEARGRAGAADPGIGRDLEAGSVAVRKPRRAGCIQPRDCGEGKGGGVPDQM